MGSRRAGQASNSLPATPNGSATAKGWPIVMSVAWIGSSVPSGGERGGSLNRPAHVLTVPQDGGAEHSEDFRVRADGSHLDRPRFVIEYVDVEPLA